MSAWVRVAKITKTRNLEGSVVARSADDLPFLLFEGLWVHFVPPSLKGPRMARVATVRSMKDDVYEIEFEGVDSIEDAESIAGCYCLASRDALPEQIDDPPIDWMGFCVHDECLGDLGFVDEVQVGPAQSLLVVQGSHGSVMIPIVDEFILDVDEDARLIAVSIPESLFDLGGAAYNGIKGLIR